MLFFQGVYVTYVDERGAAAMSGLQVHDKLLQVSGSLGQALCVF